MKRNDREPISKPYKRPRSNDTKTTPDPGLSESVPIDLTKRQNPMEESQELSSEPDRPKTKTARNKSTGPRPMSQWELDSTPDINHRCASCNKRWYLQLNLEDFLDCNESSLSSTEEF